MTNSELAILSLIVEQPRHGYEIERVIEERGLREWTEIGFSSIYYLLKKLEGKGFIQGEKRPAEGKGPARKVYQATELGYQAYFDQAIQMLTTPAPVARPFLLGLTALPALPPDQVFDALKKYASQLEDQYQLIRKRQIEQQPLEPHVKAIFDYSLKMVQTEIEWVQIYLQNFPKDA